MDKVQVDTPRDEVPDWARPEKASATAVANDALSGQPKITEAQRSYLEDLLFNKKEIPAKDEGNVDRVIKALRISHDREEFGMSKRYARELISWALTLPDKPRHAQEAHERQGRAEDLNWQKPLLDLPPGRYAIENNDGELRFYHRWENKANGRFALYVMFGPYEAKLPRPVQVAIAKKIMDAGHEKCALRFGAEIGSCSICGRTLTNRISRELSIGPVCGGRLFEDWKPRVKEARNAILDRGEDPDEELEVVARKPFFTGGWN